MKKILSFLSGGLIKDVGGVIDKLTTTDEERLAAKYKIQELFPQRGPHRGSRPPGSEGRSG